MGVLVDGKQDTFVKRYVSGKHSTTLVLNVPVLARFSSSWFSLRLAAQACCPKKHSDMGGDVM
jgi:hypothetical protein